MPKRNAQAVQVAGFDECTSPGAFYFTRRQEPPGVRAGIILSCPCGCGSLFGATFKGHREDGGGWDVSGAWPNASLSPSLGFHAAKGTPAAAVGPDGHFHWHGWLRNGVFEEC